jgi:uncharacterized damage-inducible protein DinB
LPEHLDRDGLLSLYDYNAYAVKLVLNTAEKLSEEEFTREFSRSHGSIRKLLQHTMATEAFFLAACQRHTFEFDRDKLDTLEEIRAYWDGLEHRMKTYIRSAHNEELQRPIDVNIRDRFYHLPVWQLLVQAFVHSTHHRGELSLLFSELGQQLPTLDPIIYFAEQSGQPWP